MASGSGCTTIERGWHVGRTPLDDWLTARAAQPTDTRVPVLAYGSNACPAKIDWLRTELGLPGPVVVLRARCTGLTAVWAARHRVVDDQRPATLAAAADEATVEDHAVWLATEAQLEVLDRCEGRGQRYRLARVHTGRVELETGERIVDPLAYVGLAAMRMPLLVQRPGGALRRRRPGRRDGADRHRRRLGRPGRDARRLSPRGRPAADQDAARPRAGA